MEKTQRCKWQCDLLFRAEEKKQEQQYVEDHAEVRLVRDAHEAHAVEVM
tara:strand:+ start:19 stop:165 length:147 start_codon:yes stop_codon:yes gene_type:complete